MISIIAAVAENMAIGLDNRLLYWLPADLRRFKALTTGHTIIMGRRTFESLPKGALPNRRNVVLSRKASDFPGAETFASLPEALASCAPDEEVYIIGGASVYAEALPLADRLCLTEVADTPASADAFFPSFDKGAWQETFSEEHERDEKHDQCFRFVDYVRPKATASLTVTPPFTAKEMGSGELPVLATPALVALMENAAMRAAAMVHDESDTTVGGSIDVRHLAPSAMGAEVSATATLTARDGRRLDFTITATEGGKVIGTATHTRFIVCPERFMARLN